jgi:prepilin-type N-terminal cleavage/methylation domain-containing protein/prepilin-type processing-associated H-X9-DG protein
MRKSFFGGFTLIELLVVIAIIVILAGILFPVFAAAREKGRQVVCISNEGQIGKALMMYVGDWNEKFPYNRFLKIPKDYSANSYNYYNWRRAIWPYVKNYASRECPSNKYAMMNLNRQFWSGANSGDESNRIYPKDQWIPASYALNGAYFHEGKFSPPRVRILAEMQRPADLILLIESRLEVPDLNILNQGDSVLMTNTRAIIPGFHVHMGTMNMAFCDGHVKSLKLASTIYPIQMYTDEPADQQKVVDAYTKRTSVYTFGQAWNYWAEYK